MNAITDKGELVAIVNRSIQTVLVEHSDGRLQVIPLYRVMTEDQLLMAEKQLG